MPEGDTIARLVRRLGPPTIGRTVTWSEVRVGPGAGTSLVGQVLESWESRGKHILTRFSGGLTLHTHLRMDGRWTLLPAGKVLPRRIDPDVRVILGLAGPERPYRAGDAGPERPYRAGDAGPERPYRAGDDGPERAYRAGDAGPERRAGDGGVTLYGIALPLVELVPTREEASVVGHLGPDLLGPGWDEAEAVRRLGADPARPVIEALLDQRNLAGVGNVWAVETCYLRGLHPWRPVGTVDLVATVHLVRRMLRHSTDTTGSHVTTGNTRRGETHWVYGRAGRPCRRCGTPIAFRPGAPGETRDTWWCPTCQPGAT